VVSAIHPIAVPEELERVIKNLPREPAVVDLSKVFSAPDRWRHAERLSITEVRREH
jgi:hypothetical protein